MGRKKELNPMDAYRRKQKHQQIAKNKKKRAEAKEKALQKRTPDWISSEIQKLNRREKQEHGKNAQKFENRRKKLFDALDKAQRIKRIKEKTQKIASNTTNSKSNEHESSPTPPPIEGLAPIHHHKNKNKPNDLNNDETPQQSELPQSDSNALANTNIATSAATVAAAPSTLYMDPMRSALLTHPVSNMYGHLYANPLLMHPYHSMPPSMYTDTLGAKSNAKPPAAIDENNNSNDRNHNQQSQHQRKHYEQHRRAPARDTFDPLNPANPKYNFLHEKKDKYQPQRVPFQQPPPPTHIIHPPPTHKPAAPPTVPVPAQAMTKKNEDIVRVNQTKPEIEVIMDPKLKAMMPSSMRFKRKFQTQQSARPSKKQKLNIAPDVDGGNSDALKTTSSHNPNLSNKNHRSSNSNFGAGNADAAYDKFMDEISGLL